MSPHPRLLRRDITTTYTRFLTEQDTCNYYFAEAYWLDCPIYDVVYSICCMLPSCTECLENRDRWVPVNEGSLIVTSTIRDTTTTFRDSSERETTTGGSTTPTTTPTRKTATNTTPTSTPAPAGSITGNSASFTSMTPPPVGRVSSPPDALFGPASSSDPTSSSSSGSGIPKKAAIAGFTVLGIAILLLIIFGIYFFRRKRNRADSLATITPDTGGKEGYVVEMEGGGVAEMDAGEKMGELDAVRRTGELDGGIKARELEGLVAARELEGS